MRNLIFLLRAEQLPAPPMKIHHVVWVTTVAWTKYDPADPSIMDISMDAIAVVVSTFPLLYQAY